MAPNSPHAPVGMEGTVNIDGDPDAPLLDPPKKPQLGTWASFLRLPGYKMLILCTVQITESIMTSQVLPYLPFMVQELLGTDNDADPRIGTFTGLLAASFSLAQFLSAHAWGYLSDRIGRRPVILIGLAGNFLTIPLFGFSLNLPMAFGTRFLSGLLNGNVAVAKTVLSEILDSSNQAIGFSIFATFATSGFAIGPAIGGALYGTHSYGIFGRFPYLLPCLVCASLSAFSFVIAFFKLPETMAPTGWPQTTNSDTQSSGTRREGEQGEESEIMFPGVLVDVPGHTEISPYRMLMKNRVFLISCCLLTMNSFIFVAMASLFPLWASVTWDWNPDDIGLIQSLGVLSCMVTALFIFQKVTQRFGLLRCFRVCWTPYIVACCCWFLIAELNDPTLRVVVMLLVQLIMFGFTTVCWTVANMLVPNTVNIEVLGTANGITQTSASLARTIGPSMCGVVFGLTLDNEVKGGFGSSIPLLNRHLMFFVLAFVCFAQIFLSFGIPSKYNDPLPPTSMRTTIAQENMRPDSSEHRLR